MPFETFAARRRMAVSMVGERREKIASQTTAAASSIGRSGRHRLNSRHVFGHAMAPCA